MKGERVLKVMLRRKKGESSKQRKLQLSSQGLTLHYGFFYKYLRLNIFSHRELLLPKVVSSILDSSGCVKVLL